MATGPVPSMRATNDLLRWLLLANLATACGVAVLVVFVFVAEVRYQRFVSNAQKAAEQLKRDVEKMKSDFDRDFRKR